MRISMVSTLNLDKLYELCYIKQNTVKNINALFSENIINIYNNIEISFYINDISIYEAFILKEFASSTSKLNNKHFLYKKYMPMDAPAELKKYVDAIELITEDNGIHDKVLKSSYPYLYGPCYLIHGDIIAKFTGNELKSFFDVNPIDFFLKVTGGLCATQSDDPNNPAIIFKTDYELDNVQISQHLHSMFMTKFYAYLNKRVTFVDVVTDTVSYKHFTNHSTLTKLATIRNPFLEISLKDTKKEDTTKEIDKYKQKFPKEFTQELLKLTTIDVEVYSNFSTFLELFELLPKNMFTMKEDLKIPFKFKEIYIPKEFEAYYDKLEDRYTKLQAYVEASEYNPMAMYQYTYLNSKFAYTISVKLEDINLYINPLTKEKGFIPETDKVLDSIVKFAKAAYNII